MQGEELHAPGAKGEEKCAGSSRGSEKKLMNEELKDRLECYSGKMEILM